MRRNFLVAVSLTLVVLVAAGCGGGYEAPKPVATTAPAPGTAGEIGVSARYAVFQPSVITATKGQVIQVKVSATDTNHTFTIDELGINISVAKGQTITREIKIEKAGTFAFYCSVPGHRAAGMEGTLTVTE